MGMLSNVCKCGSPPRLEFVENLVSGLGSCSTASIAMEYSDPNEAAELGLGDMAGDCTDKFYFCFILPASSLISAFHLESSS